MRIFLAGGSGTIGSRLVPELAQKGHEIIATTRHPKNLDYLSGLGAQGVVVDVYDAPHLTAVVKQAAPDLVLHELTDLSDFDTDANGRLRRAGTANLVQAAEAAGVDRMIVQSIAWAYLPGDAPANEEEQLIPGSPVEAMENLVSQLPRSTVLRYGMLYGPGTWYERGARMANAVAAGLIQATPAITPFVHIDDVIAATVLALEWPDGAYNIVDDEPAKATEWLPVYAARLGAPAPTVAELMEGTPAGRGASNTKARAKGWVPKYPSWRDGFLAL